MNTLTIWKFSLPGPGTPTPVDLPSGATPLCVHVQYGIPCVWVRVQPAAPLERWNLFTVGTGWPVDPEATYLGSWLEDGDRLVWHAFMRRADEREDPAA